MATGLVPITFLFPPGGATTALALVKPIAKSPAAANWLVKYPSEVQVWECATESEAVPFVWAALIASGKAHSNAA